MSHAFDFNNGDDSGNESEDEEITHFVGSKNIGAAHEKKKQPRYLGTSIHCSLGRQVYIRLLFGWIKKNNCYGCRSGGDWTHVG